MESGDIREEPKGKVASSSQSGKKKERLSTCGTFKQAGASKRQHPRRNGDNGTRTVGRGIARVPSNTTGKDLWIPWNLEGVPYSCSLHWTPVPFKLV